MVFIKLPNKNIIFKNINYIIVNDLFQRFNVDPLYKLKIPIKNCNNEYMIKSFGYDSKYIVLLENDMNIEFYNPSFKNNK